MTSRDTLSHTPRADVMLSTPGYSEFKNNYPEFLSLSLGEQENFLLHDLRAAMNYFSVATLDPEVVGNTEADENTKFHKAVIVDSGDIEGKIASLRKWVAKIPGLNGDKVNRYFNDPAGKSFRQIAAFGEAFPVMEASMVFLNRPNSANLEKLLSQKVPLSTILDLTWVDHKPEVDYLVEGPNAIILINLLSNARKNGKDTVRISTDQDSFTIANHSKNPLPQKLFGLGSKGNEGNFGYGLFIAQKLYAPLVGHEIIPSCSPNPKDGYDVRFSMRARKGK